MLYIKKNLILLCMIICIVSLTFLACENHLIDTNETDYDEYDLLYSGYPYSVINMDNSTRSMWISNETPYISYSEPESGKYITSINLRPPGYTVYRNVLFSMYNNGTLSGWNINIGDSPSNNGYAGDRADNSNDSELQLLNNQFRLYASDYGNNVNLHTENSAMPLTGLKRLRIHIGDNLVSYWKNYEESAATVINNKDIFALRGQSDYEGDINYMIYAGFNRVIDKYTARVGSGISQIYIYMKDPIPENTTAFWTMNDGYYGYVQNIIPTSGNTSGQMHGTVSVAKANIENTLTFDDGYVTVPDNDALDVGTGDFTISLWMRHYEYRWYEYLIQKSSLVGSQYTGYAIGINHNSPSNIFVRLASSGTGTIRVTAHPDQSTVTDGEWHMVTVVVDRSTGVLGSVTIYKDSVAVTDYLQYPDENMACGSFDNGGNVLIGGTNPLTMEQYTGELDDVMIIKRALSGSEVLSLYNDGKVYHQ